MAERVKYRFVDSFSRTEFEKGEGDWVYIRRRLHSLAVEHVAAVELYVYSNWLWKWENIGTAYPLGSFYDHKFEGPYELSPCGHAWRLKHEGGG